jgi:GMP synthase-like glutamine amidotransferase
MKIAIFQHIALEPAGYFETVFSEHKIPFEYIRLYETNEIPDGAKDATHLLFMGGPMSVNDEKELPWLREEKALIREAVKAERPVLGICLGAQLIASAFGARVYPYRQETGWCTLARAPDATGTFSKFPAQFPVFQLHGETFDLPDGARLLCSGDVVRHQAFVYRSALGLQFHLELTDAIIRDWVKDLDPKMQETIRRDTPRHLAESNRLCRMIAEDFVAKKG